MAKNRSKQVITGSEYYRKLFAYNRKVLNAYLRALSKLPWKTVAKNMEASHYSMLGIFVHILGVYNGWLNYNVYGRSSEIPHERNDPDNYKSIKDVQQFMNEIWKGVGKLLDDLDDNLLAMKVSAPWLPGTHKIADVLMQVSFEQAHHIGEIIALFWQLDKEPPEMTWLMNTR